MQPGVLRTFEFHPATVSKHSEAIGVANTAFGLTTSGVSASDGTTAHTMSRSLTITEDLLMEKKLSPIPPGEILLEEFLAPLGISQNRLANDIDVPVSRIAGIVKGRRSITADTALRLGEYFGTSPELWTNLQSSFELRLARQTYWPDAKARIRARA
jgi:addiction module HigA family antidote